MQALEPRVTVALPPDIQRLADEEQAKQVEIRARYQEERRQLRARGAIPGRVMAPRPVRPPRPQR